MTSILGEARSLDVSLKLWRERGAAPALAFVEEELNRRVRQVRRRMKKKLGKKFREGLKKVLAKPLHDFPPPPVAYRQAWEKCGAEAKRRALRDYERHQEKPEMATLHELRIRLKKWRYLLELAPKGEPRESIEGLKSLQDDIGKLHDLEVLREFLQKGRMKRFAEKAGAGHDLKSIRHRLKSEILAGRESFLERHRPTLERLLKGDLA